MTINGGGAERVIASLSSELSKKDHLNIFLVTFDYSDDSLFYPIHPNVKVVNLDIGQARKKTDIFEFFKRCFAFRKLSKKLSADIIIGFNSSTYMVLWFALIGTKIPVISSEHSSYEYFQNKYIQKSLLRLASLFTKKITVLSDIALRTFPIFLRKNMIILPNPVMHNNLGRADVSTSEKNNIILSVGRLSLEKNHMELIDAFSLIAKKIPHWDLRIVGDGDQKSKLNDRIVQLGLIGRVSLPGSKKNISKEYLQAKFFVLPSRYEGFGLVAAEALSSGLPVVGFSDCEGISRIIEDRKNGMIADTGPDRVQSLSDVLLKLTTDSDLRLSLSRNCRIPEGFDTKLVTKNWLKLFNSILRGKDI